MSKALGLMSGGLDSTLAAMALKRQGVDVTGISFATPFFGADKARKAAEKIGISLLVHDIGDIHLDMVKTPKYGYGKNMNPCIDCHAMMFRLAGEIMANEGFDFLFSGEVLGQRPMSQNADALRSVVNYSGHPERILRPLSARVLPITPMEESGLVDREQLLDISGRSRRRQEAYAKEWGLVEYPSSGGGCLLTEKHFSDRLRDLFHHQPDATPADVELLKIGRQFRLSPTAKLTLGRNQSNNDAIDRQLRPDHVLLRAEEVAGPHGLISGTPTEVDLELGAALVASYGKGKDLERVSVKLGTENKRSVEVTPLPRDAAAKLLL